ALVFAVNDGLFHGVGKAGLSLHDTQDRPNDRIAHVPLPEIALDVLDHEVEAFLFASQFVILHVFEIAHDVSSEKVRRPHSRGAAPTLTKRLERHSRRSVWAGCKAFPTRLWFPFSVSRIAARVIFAHASVLRVNALHSRRLRVP